MSARVLRWVLCGVVTWTVSTAAGSARADVVRLKDGREFEGQIKAETPEAITLDTVRAGYRLTIKLPAGEVETVTRQPLPEGFFEGKQAFQRHNAAATQAASQPAGRPVAEPQAFLLIPIKGELNTMAYAQGLDAALTAAAQLGVDNVVLQIAASSDDPTVVAAMSRMLALGDARFTYYAVVDKAEGWAAALPFLCRHVLVRPQAVLGGKRSAPPATQPGDDGQQVLEDAMVERYLEHCARQGHSPLLTRVMIVPARGGAAWKTADGEVQVGESLPADVPASQVIVKTTPGEYLRITGQQLADLGMVRLFSGAPATIGQRLGIPGWKSAGNAGVTAMDQALAQEKAALASPSQRPNTAMDDTIQRYLAAHDALVNYTLGYLKDYVSRDPRTRTWPVNNVGVFDDITDRNQNVRLAIGALNQARRGLAELAKLDKQAAAKGIQPPTYPMPLGQADQLCAQQIALLNQTINDTQPKVYPNVWTPEIKLDGWKPVQVTPASYGRNGTWGSGPDRGWGSGGSGGWGSGRR